MPTYEYRCSECGHEFEEHQPITSNPLVKCPKCGRDSLRRVMGGGGGMIFKGGGFYQTDYKKSGEKKTDSSSKEQPPKDSTTKGKDSVKTPPKKPDSKD